MRNRRRCAGIIGTLGVASQLGGCNAWPGDPWFGALALVVSAGAAAVAGWLAGQARSRRALHAARQDARLLSALAGGEIWHTTLQAGQPPRLADGRRIGEAYTLGAQAPAIEALLARDVPLTAMEWLLADGGRRAVSALPWYHNDGRLGGHVGLTRPADAGGLSARALQLLCESWPDDLAVLTRRSEDDPWQVLQASASVSRQLEPTGTPATIDHPTLLALLPGATAPVLNAAGETEAEGWRVRQLRIDGQALLLLVRSSAGPADDTATLSYTVSHDLRAPIRVVEGFTRIVKEDYGSVLDRVANDHLDRVLGATARMNQMIDAMLTLARLSSQPLARQPVNLSQLASFVAEDLRRGAPDREAVIEIEPALQVNGDPTLLRLVLENLLGNAWKYTTKRTQTHIVFGREVVDGKPAYVVRDNGAGFDMRSAERLFGLFQRLHSSSDFAGTGVGLASVRRIVQRHGGRVWADGEPGRGAAFYFTLRD